MSILLYKFDSVGDFPVLESYTTLRGSVATRVDGRGDNAVLRVVVEPHEREADDAVVVIALPPVAVDGRPEQFELTLDGDASHCELLLEAADARGDGFTYSFGTVDFAGTRTCVVEVQRPIEVWGRRHGCGQRDIIPPVQLFRLGIKPAPSCQGVDLGLVTLAVAGDVRLAPPGIA